MPSLVLFGKRTPMAGDDLRVYGIITLLARLTQVAASISLMVHMYSVVGDAEDICILETDEQNLVKNISLSFLCLSVVLALVGAAYATAVLVLTQQGTPTDRQGRAGLPWVCQVHLTAVVALRIVVVALGLRMQWGDDLDHVCHCVKKSDCDAAFLGLFYFVLYSELAELILDMLLNLYLASSSIQLIPRQLLPDSQSKWRLFFQCCCTLTSVLTCCVMGGPDAILGDFKDIAMVFSDFFNLHGALDITDSDVVIGLLLVQQVQEQRMEEARQLILKKASSPNDVPSVEQQADDTNNDNNLEQVVHRYQDTKNLSGVTYRLKRYEGGRHHWQPAVTKFLEQNSDSDKLAIAEGARYMRLSLAIYAWIMYCINRPCTGLCTICCASAVRSCHKRTNRYEGEGYCCPMHSTALIKEGGILDEADIVYAYFRSDVVASPYAVVLDHEWKSIVIVIRGTLSLEDVLTDLEMTPSEFGDTGDGETRYGHNGFLQTAEWIIKDLKKNQTLDKLLDAQSKFSQYRLRVTGHSLGAGCAAILAMLLKPKYPNLKCHAFSPPGCTVSENAAQECESYVISYALDCDIVPRLSLNALDNLRQDVVDKISRIKVPKSQVLDEVVGNGCCGRRRGSQPENRLDHLMYKEDEVPESEFVQEWQKYREIYDAQKLERGQNMELELFLPGRILHLKGNLIVEDQPKVEKYKARWANRLDFREIIISSHFLDDHAPILVLKELELEAGRFGLELPFVVASKSGDVCIDQDA